MELPRIGKSDRGGVLDGIKNKLGFANDNLDDYDEEYYSDENYAYTDDYEDDYDNPSSSSYIPAGARSSTSGSSRLSRSTNPPLVSIDDVRSRTQIPDSLNRDPLPERRISSSQGASSVPSSRSGSGLSGRKVEHAVDYLRSTDTSDNAHYQEPVHSAGYNSLFSSTTTSSASETASLTTPSSKAYDPYDAFASSGVGSHNPSRLLSVLKPMSYGEVEIIAKTVKAGDVVILSLRNTPDRLAKRILDFSFGVSSALDASVECIADKVFAVVKGRELSSEEKTDLRNKGVF